MRAAAILAQGKAPDEREVIFRNAQSYVDRGRWIPAITTEQFPVLFFPGDTQRQATFAEAIRNAQEVGELSLPSPGEPQGLWPLQWAAWPGLPPVPTDSPLIHWLPEWLPSAAARLETTTAASPTEPAPAGGAAPFAGEPAGVVKGWTPERRKKLLAKFRDLGGKRPAEKGKKGKHGALAALVRTASVDKDTLGQQLDTAIKEKANAALWEQLNPAK